MSSVPKPIHDAAAAFDSLPGIGPRAALRYAYWLAAQSRETIKRFAQGIESMAEGVERCTICGSWTDHSGCSICADPKRIRSQLCVVSTSQDVRVIEDSGVYAGLYHVLGGLIDPIEGRTPETLNIASLLTRIRQTNSAITELILALDPDILGDTTALYLTKQLQGTTVQISRLARGIQHGAQIEYADGATIADALSNRKRLQQ